MAFRFLQNVVPSTNTDAIFKWKEFMKKQSPDGPGWLVVASGDGLSNYYNLGLSPPVTSIFGDGDCITKSSYNPGGLDNPGAWFVIQQPKSQRQISFQRCASSSLWRIKYAPKGFNLADSFTSASRVPCANINASGSLDEAILYGSGTDAAPVGSDLFSGLTEGRYVLQACANNELVKSKDIKEKRLYHTTNLLRNNTLLIAGGCSLYYGAPGNVLKSCEIYDYTNGSLISASTLRYPRFLHSSTDLSNGRVFIVGGKTSVDSAPTSTTEIYDTVSQVMSDGPSMSVGRSGHSSIKMNNGKVLVVGGNQLDSSSAAEIYDPVYNTFSSTGGLNAKFDYQSLVELKNKKILAITYSSGDAFLQARLYDGYTGLFTTTETDIFPRTDFSTSLLKDGTILVAGGKDLRGNAVTYSCVYDINLNESQNKTMALQRHSHNAISLPSGDVLIVGGKGTNISSSIEIYRQNVGGGTFSSLLNMSSERIFCTSTLLPENKLFVLGGTSDLSNTTLSSFDLISLSDNSFTVANKMREGHTESLLKNGHVLFTGGTENGSSVLSSCFIFDPDTEFFQSVGSMNEARTKHTATVLQDGSVLIVGGNNGSYDVKTAEIYNPVTKTFRYVGSMASQRSGHTSTLLKSGKVLVAGGGAATADLYNPKTEKFASVEFSGFSLSTQATRQYHTSTLLLGGSYDGYVLLVGGGNNSSELYNPKSGLYGSFSSSGTMSSSRSNHTATLLEDGNVLVAGGGASNAQVYNVSNKTFGSNISMAENRSNHSATLLKNGKVIVTGGNSGNNYFYSVELFNPVTSSFATLSKSLPVQRSRHTATMLKNGNLLIFGGKSSASALPDTFDIYRQTDDNFFITSIPYNFYFFTYPVTKLCSSNNSIKTLFIYDPVKECSFTLDDTNPVSIICMNSNTIQSLTTPGDYSRPSLIGSTVDTKLNERVFVNLSIASYGQWYNSNAFTMSSEQVSNCHTKKEDVFPCYYFHKTKNITTKLVGYKGISSMILVSSSSKKNGDFLSVKNNGDNIFINGFVLPWNNSYLLA